eukprot:20088-Chlamydomonas_euryale.AAC.2
MVMRPRIQDAQRQWPCAEGSVRTGPGKPATASCTLEETYSHPSGTSATARLPAQALAVPFLGLDLSSSMPPQRPQRGSMRMAAAAASATGARGGERWPGEGRHGVEKEGRW